MKLMIEIDEELYEEVKGYHELTECELAIFNGTPIPDNDCNNCEKTMNKWILVNEGLPKEGQSVTVSTTYNTIYAEARYTKEHGWEWLFDIKSDHWKRLKDEDVTAWMPLPNIIMRNLRYLKLLRAENEK